MLETLLNSPALTNNVPTVPSPFTVLHRGEAKKRSKTLQLAEDESSKHQQQQHHEHSCEQTSRKRSAGEYNNLVTAVYSVCCLYQFIRYLPLLILRVCFGAGQQQQQQRQLQRAGCQSRGLRSSQLMAQQQQQQQDSGPNVRTVTGLMLLGLPLLLLAGLPIVGRLVASPPSSTSSRASSRSRASSISSVASQSRAGRVYSSSMSSVEST